MNGEFRTRHASAVEHAHVHHATGEAPQPQAPRFCPHCGVNIVHPGDVCEHCGAWLLPGQCVFCYAPVHPADAFCGACGNLPEGIACPRCGKLSIFDYCSTCRIALTSQATQMEEALRSDPLVHALLEALQEERAGMPVAEPSPAPATPPLEGAPPEGAARSESRPEAQSGIRPETRLEVRPEVRPKARPEAPPEPVSPRDAQQAAGVLEQETEADECFGSDLLQSLKAQDAAAATIAAEAERQRSLEAEVRQRLAAAQQRSFETPQEARRFFNALTVVLEETNPMPSYSVWICNAFGSTHPNPGGPNFCADPSQGGEVVYLYEPPTDLVIEL